MLKISVGMLIRLKEKMMCWLFPKVPIADESVKSLFFYHKNTKVTEKSFLLQ